MSGSRLRVSLLEIAWMQHKSGCSSSFLPLLQPHAEPSAEERTKDDRQHTERYNRALCIPEMNLGLQSRPPTFSQGTHNNSQEFPTNPGNRHNQKCPRRSKQGGPDKRHQARPQDHCPEDPFRIKDVRHSPGPPDHGASNHWQRDAKDGQQHINPSSVQCRC